jgi:ferrous iron transport protein A
MNPLPARQARPVYDQIPLHLLLPGQQAEIFQLVGAIEHVQRLEEMGLRQGAAVEMVQSGSPCIVRIGGHKLCFRQSEALSVLVRITQVA